jgi:hypothetical protein
MGGVVERGGVARSLCPEHVHHRAWEGRGGGEWRRVKTRRGETRRQERGKLLLLVYKSTRVRHRHRHRHLWEL